MLEKALSHKVSILWSIMKPYSYTTVYASSKFLVLRMTIEGIRGVLASWIDGSKWVVSFDRRTLLKWACRSRSYWSAARRQSLVVNASIRAGRGAWQTLLDIIPFFELALLRNTHAQCVQIKSSVATHGRRTHLNRDDHLEAS